MAAFGSAQLSSLSCLFGIHNYRHAGVGMCMHLYVHVHSKEVGMYFH